MRSKQKGYLLIELAVAAVLATLIGMQTVSWWRHKAQEQRFEALAGWMLALQKGVQQYLFTSYDSSSLSTPLGEPHEITVSQLIQDGFVSSALHQTPELKIRVFAETNCLPERCHVHSVIYTDTALEKIIANSSSEYWLNYWLSLTADRGLVVRPSLPTQLVGIYQQFNNAGADIGATLPANTLAVYASIPIGQRQFLQFYEKENPNFETEVDINGYMTFKKTEQPNHSCQREGSVTRATATLGLLMCDGTKWVELFTKVDAPSPLSSGSYEVMVHQSFNFSECSNVHPVLGQCACLANEKPHLTDTRYSGSSPATSTFRYETYLCTPL